MSAIGSLVFCNDCGNLLPVSQGGKKAVLICACCNAENKDTGSKSISTSTKPTDFPSQLRQKLQSKVQTIEKHKVNTHALIDETCPKCGREEVYYTQLQLRGADEGSTTFYTCKCGNRWSQNN
ncbi:DNA-directed RNA polymerase I core subunit rpa12 [Verticillium nonalfalfae]|uniref:DNA-directed RNA polymerase subunit n=2 Tax=Verticillium TaxID=1036719 RepID=C9S906_VERA1|nr:DNA-directed RNA polymerase I subunit RPA12 [Verticillium alfalfae VaMs.102]XP_028491656.1 DNA-directed RNA polymerase I core subunit rpa12 [Verticillium nonalfalfae]EEY14979.1 DNA-directed RNA polymerase I subunit RPA12 [Verticillium alfalfae VaMs.102]RNJ53498.1 DNA-directed RNA polymerase I core subunit rpa12 [Verticillium nonalfalfae]